MIQALLWCLFRAPTLVSWLTSCVVTAALLAPCILALKFIAPQRALLRHATAGALLGLAAIPLSLWFYLHFFVGPLRGLIFGFPGILMLQLHLSLFRSLSPVSHGMVEDPAGGFAAGLWDTGVGEVAFWIVTYGLLGTLVGWIRRDRRASAEGA